MTATDIRVANQMMDLEEFLTDLAAEMTDEQFIEYKESTGLDLWLLADIYVDQYNDPDNEFMRSLKSKKLAGIGLTVKQRRAALNVWWRHLHGVQRGGALKDTRQLECFKCHETFVGMDALMEHKERAHPAKPTFTHAVNCIDKRHDINTVCPVQEEVKQERVVEVQEGKLMLDLKDLPDGRYAVPDISAKNDYVFLMVKRVRRTHWRDRRFVYGKVITGGEFVEAGTIEVKVWSSDSKELIGEQTPGKLYEGKYEIELQAIQKSPAVWAKLFGSMIGRCGICGKTLTDDISRSDGFGPECVKKINDGYWKVKPKDFTNRNQYGVPWCEKHKDYHQPWHGCR